MDAVHAGVRKFACRWDKCGKRFGARGDVTRHVESVHEGKRRFSCAVCGKCFTRRSVVKRHVRGQHAA